MPTYTRPTDYPQWTTGNPGVQVEPTLSQKFAGWFVNQRPPNTWMNWLFGNISDWINWLDQQVQANNNNVTYDAVVGTNGTFPDINTLMASANIANIKNVLISTPQTLTATQVINQPDMVFTFKPQAWYSPAFLVADAIHITAPRVRIFGGRFYSFTGNVITLEVGADNCLISQVYFHNNTGTISDLASNTTLADNVEEV